MVTCDHCERKVDCPQEGVGVMCPCGYSLLAWGTKLTESFHLDVVVRIVEPVDEVPIKITLNGEFEGAEMNNIVHRWIEALRNPTVQQGFGGQINDDGTRCAVGVLAELLVEEDPTLQHQVRRYKMPNTTFTHGGSYLSTMVLVKRCGVDRQFLAKVMYLNDREKLSFEQIAAFIESSMLNPRMMA